MFFLSGSKGISWHDRGDIAAYDYTLADFVDPFVWYTFNLSSIVGIGKHLVKIRCIITTTTNDQHMYLRTKGYTDVINIHKLLVRTLQKNYDYSILVETDENGCIEGYRFGLYFTVINIAIQGWFA